MRGFPEVAVAGILLMASLTAYSQTSPPLGIGRVATAEEMKAWMYAVGPEGKELLPGKGTAAQGEAIFNKRCIFCHGPEGHNGPWNSLRGSPMLPHVTSMWDYIHRAMPRKLDNPGAQEVQLSPDEVYALTAYILHLNGIIQHDMVVNNENLPSIRPPFDK